VATTNAKQLIVHHGALGDWALILPIVRAMQEPTLLAAAWSRAQLAATLYPWITPIDIEQHGLSLLHVEDGHSRIGDALRKQLANVRTIISFVSDGHDAWSRNVAKLLPEARCHHIHPRPPAAWTRHITDWHMSQLREQGLSLLSSHMPALNHPQGPIVIHPGSGGAQKCWPAERFEQVIAALREQGHRVQVLLGEAEMTRWPQEMLAHWQSRYDARLILELNELHHLLRDAKLFLGNDAGPTHLAAQLGMPTIALFGPTLPQIWAPVGPQVRVIAPATAQTMHWLDVSRVVAAVAAMLGQTTGQTCESPGNGV